MSAPANFYDVYWDAIKPVIAATWTDVLPGRLWQDNAMERIDWTQRWNDAQLAPPWVVVKIDINKASGWGLAPVYQIDATVFYINKISVAPGGTTITTYIMGKLAELQKNLFRARAQLGTVLPDMPFDISADNPVNASFLDADLPLQGGSLTCSTLVVAARNLTR